MSKRSYHPERGDLIHLNFAPSAGREFTGPHYGLVISARRFNRQTGLIICLPTTTKFHETNLQMELPEMPELRQRGWVWIHQVKTLDYRERSATFVCKMPADFVVKVMERTRLLLDPQVEQLMRGGIGIVILVASTLMTGAGSVAAATSRPATTTTAKASTSRPSARALERGRAAVRDAVKALSGEYSSRNPRASCNYFKDNPSVGVTDEAIVEELLLVTNWDVRRGAYVRWQMLSGLSEEIDGQVVDGLRRAYAQAPAPFPRPSITQRDQQQLDGMVQGRKQGDEADLKQEMRVAFETFDKDNQPILAYRDELYARLPKTTETLAAALEDLLVRMNAVADGKDLVKAVAKDAREWALNANPSPQQLAAMASAVRKLADSKGPQYYNSVSWRESSRAFAWSKTRSGIDSGHALEDLAIFLQEQGRQPPLTLDIKETKPTKETHGR